MSAGAAIRRQRERERGALRRAGSRPADNLSATAPGPPRGRGSGVVAVDHEREAVAEFRRRAANLLTGDELLGSFMGWLGHAEDAIRLHGTEADVALMEAVVGRVSDYMGRGTTAAQMADGLRRDIGRALGL